MCELLVMLVDTRSGQGYKQPESCETLPLEDL